MPHRSEKSAKWAAVQGHFPGKFPGVFLLF
jgi:hypothetical protein